MNQKINILMLLLVIILMEFAHAKSLNKINDTKLSTSSSMINNGKNHIADENNIVNDKKIRGIKKYSSQEDNISIGGNKKYTTDLSVIFSVVQDWNLVCKQLCGAGLGGPTCGQPQCEDIKNSQSGNITIKANQLLKTKEDLICQDLCKYELGGDICTCQPNIFSISIDSPPSVMWDRNQVCYTFCLHNDITLIGCSLCSKNRPTIAATTQSTIVTKKTTTPNWKEICDALCKTGDGGALCNCDKPPFF